MLLGLGRLQAPDDRDKEFPMTAILPAKESKRKFRYWNEGPIKVNQGTLPACTGAAMFHLLINGPVTQDPKKIPSFIELYKGAQENDEWEGSNYAGSSVRGAAKYAQSLGLLGNYLWAQSIDDIIQAVLEVGPVDMGTNWYRGMSWPDKNGIVRPSGILDAGHSYLFNGINMKRELLRAQQSWYPTWGDSGNFWISFADAERLLKEDGEALLATEIKAK